MTHLPLPAPDIDAGLAMWREYAAAHPERVHDDEDPVVEYFGDHVALAEELLGLVLGGPKRATASLVREFAEEGQPLPRIGGHWIACDSTGAPRAILRTTELRIGTAESVDDAFAFDEGEGDRTRDSWLREHRRYWERVCAAAGTSWAEDLEVVFERFAVVWPPAVIG